MVRRKKINRLIEDLKEFLIELATAENDFERDKTIDVCRLDDLRISMYELNNSLAEAIGEDRSKIDLNIEPEGHKVTRDDLEEFYIELENMLKKRKAKKMSGLWLFNSNGGSKGKPAPPTERPGPAPEQPESASS